ncbi:DoxX family protein [Corynebacterium sp.]|uniref:DoxX family protein n=1 Tax=Corynebacterium sp. TaxID=1720 RepID=UPI0026DAA65F|nr:DoxX family protein [Corynebacterium sp.]MDO4611139.1 DoxX family protein [Corynebacterium sp.]
MDRPAVRDGALLIVRLIVGGIFAAHGWDKIFITGVDATTGYFVGWGIPQAEMTVWLAAMLEMIGGALLVLGLLAPIVAGVLVVEMLIAAWFVHMGNGLFIADGGPEFVLSLIAGLIIIVVFGAGRASLDRVFTR